MSKKIKMKMDAVQMDTEYRNQEELYRRIVDQYGRDNHGNQHFEINDTGTSFELINTKLRESEHIYVGIELPVAIEEGATSQVNMMACLTDFSDVQRSRKNVEYDEYAEYWDGMDTMMRILKRFERFRDILYAPKKTDDPKFHYRRGYVGEGVVWLDWSADGPEYIYTIPTEKERDLIHLVTDFRLDQRCVFNLHESVREIWQFRDLYGEWGR